MIFKFLSTLLLLTPSLLAQGSTTYDVSVIHRSKALDTSNGIGIRDTTFEATDVSIKRLLEAAYDIRPDLISGVPSAIESQRYDLTAKVLDPDVKALEKLTPVQQSAMILPVLQERFALKAHVEIKDLPVLELITIPGVSKLTALPTIDPTAGPSSHNVNVSRRSLEANDIDMSSLCKTLGNLLHKTIIDRTGLTASFSITVKFSPDDNTDSANQDPPLLTALQEQLGLKLKPSRGPVPTLVVDHIEAPTEN